MTPRPPRKTARQLRADAYEDEWRALRNRSGRPKAARQKARALRPQECIRMLEEASRRTGDPRFVQALEAIKSYGFDKEPARTMSRVQREMFGSEDDGYLTQINYLHTRGKVEDGGRRRLSVREACEAVVAESGYPAPSFKAAVDRLRKRYMAR